MRCRIFGGVAALLSSSRRFFEKVVVWAATFSLGSSWVSGETVGFEAAEGYALGTIVFDAADVESQGSLRSEVVFDGPERGQVVELTVAAGGGTLAVDVLSSESGDRLGSLLVRATGIGHERVTVGGIAIDFAGAPDSWRELALGRRSESGYPVTLDGSVVGYLGALAGVQVVFHPVQGTLSIDELTWIDTEEGEPAPTQGLLREVWLGIRGNHLSKLRESGTFPGTPSIVDVVPDFEAPSNWANNYGTRLRGYLTAPLDGVYEFWISGDDRSELYLSPDSNPLNAVQIAQVPGWTGIREWEKYADEQVSVGVTLAAGEPVYIEALQKEGGGRDNLAVAWRGPGIPERTVITGSYLTPWEAASPYLGNPSFAINAGPSFSIYLPNREFELNGVAYNLGAFDSEPQILWSPAGSPGGVIEVPDQPSTAASIPGVGEYFFDLSASEGDWAFFDTLKVTARAPLADDVGGITHESWLGLSNTQLNQFASDPDLLGAPDLVRQLESFDGPYHWSDRFAARVRGYVLAPVSGSYRFWVSGNDSAELWLATDGDPENVSRIAFTEGGTKRYQLTKSGSQASVAIALDAGQRIYVEARHREKWGEDHISVFWQTPETLKPTLLGSEFLAPATPAPLLQPALNLVALAGDDRTLNSPRDSVGLDGGFKRLKPSEEAPGFQWTQIDGPGVVSFDDQSDPQTQAHFPGLGVYTLQLEVSDSLGSAVDTVVFELVPALDPSVGGVTREVWFGIPHTRLDRLQRDPRFAADDPDFKDTMPTFEAPAHWADEYGTRMRALLMVPKTGWYRFWVAGDDQSQLWLNYNPSGSADPSGASMIAQVKWWSEFRRFDQRSEQKSKEIYLEEGRQYFIEGLQKEGGGGDHLSVAWQGAGIPRREVLDGAYLIPYSPAPAHAGALELVVDSVDSLYWPQDSVEIHADVYDLEAGPQAVTGEWSKKSGPDGVVFEGLDGFNVRVTFPEEGSYVLQFSASDGANVRSVDVPVEVFPSLTAEVGGITREVWFGIRGNELSKLTDSPDFPDRPFVRDIAPEVATPVNWSDSYGVRLCGYLIPPEEGEYTFWLSGDDHSELWLSEDDSAVNATKRAHVYGWTNYSQWDRYGSQKSEPVHLEGGRRYYIEVLSKEGWGGDHVEVAWQGPGISRRQIIDGAFLEPCTPGAPMISDQSLFVDAGRDQSIFWPGDCVTLSGTHHYARTVEGRSLSFQWSVVSGPGAVRFSDEGVLDPKVWFGAPGVYTLSLNGADGVDAHSDSVVVTVEAPLASDTGAILREVWMAMGGKTVSHLTDSERYPESPTIRDNMHGFESPSNWANSYGARYRGYLRVPVEGDYEFFLSSDDYSELWLSETDDAGGARQIAVVNSWNRKHDWYRKAHQRSGLIRLEPNTKYYIEARHKEYGGSDHFAVGWRRPGASEIEVIDRGFLVPLEVAPEFSGEIQLLTQTPQSMVWPESEAQLLGLAYDLRRGPERLTYLWEALDAGASLDDPSSRAPRVSFAGPGEYRFRFNVSDGFNSANKELTVSVAPGAPGSDYGLLREVWFGIRGNDLSRLFADTRYPDTPDLVDVLPSSEAPRDWENNYATRLRGYLHPPESGVYYLWIAGDDETRLSLGTDRSASSAREVAWIDGWTSFRQWNKNEATQRSGPLTLSADQSYYLEVLHKEGWGGDHISIGWSRAPDQEPTLIPAGYLTPLHPAMALDEEIQVSAGPDSEIWAPEFQLDLQGFARDLKSGPYQLEAGWIAPPGVTLTRDNDVSAVALFEGPGSYELILRANDGLNTRSDSVVITVHPALDRNTGFVIRETYHEISGGSLSALRSAEKFPDRPDLRDWLTSLEGPVNWMNNYGTRIRGYLHPPADGEYVFWISGDDNSEFWLGSNDQQDSIGTNPIARVPRWTSSRQWTKFAEQESAPKQLAQGEPLYFEILHKEGGGGDNIAVAWQGPGMDSREIISGAYLSPYTETDDTDAPLITLLGAEFMSLEVGSSYVEPGYSASDTQDGDLTSKVEVIGEVDASTPGQYIVAYSVRDYSGNSAELKRRTVKVERVDGRGTNDDWPPAPPAEFTPPPASGWTLPSTVSESDAARFLTQATFGSTSDSIAALRSKGFDQWFEEQNEVEPSLHLPHLREALTLLGEGLYYGDASMGPVIPKKANTDDRLYTWWTHAIEAPDQLRQRMAFALSEILVVSDRSPALRRYPEGMANYYDILVRHALGNYRDLIEDVSLSPIMGIYLTTLRNTKPDYEAGVLSDENYARELLQLFSIGLKWLNPDGTPRLDPSGQTIPTFGMDEILAFARVFTGWTFNGSSDFFWTRWGTEDVVSPMMAFEEWHDTDPKTLLGGVTLPGNQTAYADLSDALDNIFYHPNVGPFIAHALIQRLVTSNPSPGYIYRVASVFDDNGVGVRGDLAAVAKAIFLDEEARSPAFIENDGYGKLREPILRLSSLIRAFYSFQTDSPPTLGRFGLSTDIVGPLGQAPLYAPSVFNFFDKDYSPMGPIAEAGLVAPEFQITSEASVVTGANYFHSGVDRGFRTDSGFLERIVLNLAEALAQGADVDGLLDLLDGLFTSGHMSSETRSILRSMLVDIGADTVYRAKSALQLLITSPEYVIQR